MNNFFNFNHVAYNAADVSAPPDPTTLGTTTHRDVLSNWISTSSTESFWRADKMDLIGAQAAPIYPSSIQNNAPVTQWQTPFHSEAFSEGFRGFHPSSSSLAGALGWETGPRRNLTDRVGRYNPYLRTSVHTVHENEAGPSTQLYPVTEELTPVLLSTLPAFDQAVKADAEEATQITEEDQDAPTKRKKQSRRSRTLLQAAMKDLKHELEENWRYKSISEVEALSAAFLEIASAGLPPVHAEQILVNREDGQRPRPARERSKRAKREQEKRDKTHAMLEELSRYVPWPTCKKHGPCQQLVVQKAVEILRGLPTRGLASGA